MGRLKAILHNPLQYIGMTAVSKEVAGFSHDGMSPHGHAYSVPLVAVPALVEEYKRTDMLDHVEAGGRGEAIQVRGHKGGA
ncbi:hypothetical protein [Stygiolobus caldivivus]|uniref:Uncharacterized protein n=1 Tax=Stygiolobus caldivivus TaxID=2824673 RepID=A0A8D5U692_9CREN|nr:hypothetical protein [Stygiolobus caldivivus]BCU69788.1 hypothetical protein KN1_10850 [Stygiolobus caldivivus]